MIDFVELGGYLKAIREKCGISCRFASETIGCSRMMLWKIEHGDIKNPYNSSFLAKYFIFLMKKHNEKIGNFWYMDNQNFVNYYHFLVKNGKNVNWTKF